jgi:zinc transport system substrate-binding protein
MKIFKLDKGIEKISIQEHHHSNDHTKDPHIWLNPDNVKIIAKNILNYLIKLDTNNKSFYTKNYKRFINKIIKTNEDIKNNLKKMKNKHFMVFHPSWGYFAKYYGLSQIAIEVQGKNPTAREMINIIKKAKKYNLKTIISTSQTSDKLATQIAKTLNMKVIKVNSLSPNWSKNLIYVSKILSNK